MNYTFARLNKSNPKDWFVYYSYRDPITGRLKPFKIRGDINRIKSLQERKREAIIIITERNTKLQNGWSPFSIKEINPMSHLNLTQALDEVIKQKSPDIRDVSVKTYRSTKDLFVEFLRKKNLENISPASFSPLQAQAYMDYMVNEKKYEKKTINNHVIQIKVLFQFLVKKKVMPASPVIEMERKKIDEGSLMWYSESQRAIVREFLSKNKTPMGIFIQLIYYCGLRPKEIMHLQVEHIDWENKSLSLFGTSSKNKKNAIIPIPNDILDLLFEFKNLAPDQYLFSTGLRPGSLLTSRNRATEAHRKLLNELGIGRQHKLYHWKNTSARDYIIAGNTPHSLMALFRHHSLDQTMVYLRSLGITTGMKINPNAWVF